MFIPPVPNVMPIKITTAVDDLHIFPEPPVHDCVRPYALIALTKVLTSV